MTFWCWAVDNLEKCVKQSRFKQIDFEQLTPSHIDSSFSKCRKFFFFFGGILILVSWQAFISSLVMKLDFISQPSSKSTLPFAGLQHMQQCQVNFHTKQQKLSNIQSFFFYFFQIFQTICRLSTRHRGSDSQPNPCLTPGCLRLNTPWGGPWSTRIWRFGGGGLPSRRLTARWWIFGEFFKRSFY